MPSAFDRFALDAAKFVDPTLFGVPATYTRDGAASSTTINVSFAEPIEAFGIGEVNAIDSQPGALARASDVPNAGRGDRLDVAGGTYAVIEALPDGFGHVWLRLTVVANTLITGNNQTLLTGGGLKIKIGKPTE
jgi:hypothetical protein